MAKEIKMPQLSDTMDSGKILSWNKAKGDTVSRGDILAEVETDKANLEIESFFEGVLLKIVTKDNETANVGDVIAYIGKEGEEVDSVPSEENEVSEVSLKSNEENNEPEVKEEEKNTEEKVVEKNDSSSSSEDVAKSQDSKRLKASPLAKKLAEGKNVDLSQLYGSGPNGRITKKDVEGAIDSVSTSKSSKDSSNTEANSAYQTQSSKSSDKNVSPSSTPLSKMRLTIANRMQQAVTEVPHFFTTVSINMSQAKSLRKQFKENEDLKSISINHLVIKAAAYAIAKEPRVNCNFKDGSLVNPGVINIGVVTAVDDGLLIPVIKDADKLDLNSLAFETRAAIDRARAGRPSSSDLSGGTFSISNMGMFDVENFTAIINPGQGAILAVSSVIDTPVATVSSGVEVAPMMKVTLSVDHRIIDGTISSQFLHHFKSALESPALMLV